MKFLQIELDGIINGGKAIFVDLPDSCFFTRDLVETTKNYNVYTDHENLVQVRLIKMYDYK